MYRPVALVHHSLRFDANERELTRALEDDMAHGAVVTVTEVGSHRALRVLQGIAHAHGWQLAAPGDRAQHESAVLWDPSVARREYRDTFKPTDQRLDTHRKAELWAHGLLFSLAAHPAAKFWVATGHPPAHVQGQRGFRKIARWAKSVAVYHRYLGGIKRRMKGRTPRVFAFDFNLDWRKGWVRGYIRRRFPGMRCGWPTKPLPEAGTHGHRIIDWHMVRGLRIVEPTRLLGKHPGLDHRAIVTVVGVPDPAA